MVAGDGSSIEAKPEVKEEEMAVKEEGDQSSHAGDQSMTTATEDIAVHDAVVPDSGDVGHQKFCESIMEALGRLLTKYGSWGSFLKSRFGTTESATECCDFLHELCEAHETGHSLQHPLTSVSLGTLNTGGSKSCLGLVVGTHDPEGWLYQCIRTFDVHLPCGAAPGSPDLEGFTPLEVW